MRAILLVLILAVAVALIALATGYWQIDQTREARVPDIDATGNGIAVKGGQAPAFDVDAGSVSVGARQTNVTVPVPEVRVKPADGGDEAAEQPQAATGNNAQ